ncbi:MAG: hypothetical protein U1F08_02060 [Steroidobacteraceae bacterium]
MSDSTGEVGRPAQVRVLCVLLLLAGLFAAMLGWSASAYYYTAGCLLVLAVLLWTGRAAALVRWVLAVNVLAGTVLVLVLWLGDGLGHAKLDVSGVAFLVNHFLGGPFASLLALAILPGLRRDGALAAWFAARGA